MTLPATVEVQRAIAFLSKVASAKDGEPPLPPTPGYDALARRACASGCDVSAEAIEEAFRLIMRARLVARGRNPGTGVRRV